MRRFSSLLASAVLIALAACADAPDQTPTTPKANPTSPQFGPPAVGNPYCSPTSSDAITAELEALFALPGWPNMSAAKGMFQTVQSLLADGDIPGAQRATRTLVDFVSTQFAGLTPEQRAVSQTLFDQVIVDLWCYVGISGKVFDLNPGDPEKAFDLPTVGGVDFPPNVVPVGTLVSLTDITGQGCPLFTVLDCFPGFLSISLYPPSALPQLPTVVLCPPSTVPVGATVLVGHQAQTGFEVLPFVPPPPLLAGTCSGSSAQREGPRDWLAQVVASAVDLLLPQPVQAAPMLFAGGIGGRPSGFSPFAVVSTTLSGAGGLGGKPSGFVPPPSNGPAAAPPNNPPLPPTFVQGPVGTKALTGLPFVTITTLGGDVDGSNPVAGVTVTFTTGASQLYDPDSQAKVCDAGGNLPASGQIQVVTDLNGIATLPCIAFGNVAGFANLAATFDPTSLNFPGSNLVTIVATDGITSSSSLNWLVRSNAGQPAALSFTTAPSASAQAGVAFTQQPALQLLDGLGNEVFSGGLTVTAAVTNGGGTASYTAPVTADPNGVATFTDLAIGGPVAGTDQALSFSFVGIAHPLTAVVHLTAGPASKLAITTQPSGSVQAGVAFGGQPVVTIQDQFGNTANSTSAVVASLATGAGALAGTTSVNAIAGVATFGDLRIDGLIGDRTLAFTSGSFTSPPSTTISVGAGPASQLTIESQPSSTAKAGIAFPTQPVVAIRDQFGNLVNSTASVVAGIATGAGSLAGTNSVAAVGGTATFGDLRIDGAAGNRTLRFALGSISSPGSNTIAVGAGSATGIQTFIGGVAAPAYSYGGNLSVLTNASPVPQVIVTDGFGNPVGNQIVYWNASTTNRGLLTVGSTGTPTNGAGTAQIASWLLGDGLNQATAGLFAPGVTPAPPSYVDAQFSATTPIGAPVFACAAGTGNAKTDVGPLSIKAPSASIRRVTLWMSVNGATSPLSSYNATLEARLNGLTGTLLKSTTGNVLLPNTNAAPVSFTFAAPIAKQSSTATIWFKLTIAAPSPQKPQVWYSNSTPVTTDACFGSLVYAPGSTTVFKRGLSIHVGSN